MTGNIFAYRVNPVNVGDWSGPRHYLSRKVTGHTESLPLPLCWDAEGQQRGATDEEWFLSWDHGAIEPSELWFATGREHVTCRDCIEWLRA